MGVEAFAAVSRYNFWKIIGIYRGICYINGLQSAAAETTLCKLVSIREIIPTEIVGGVGWLSRIRVSRPASSVVGGLLALGGLCIAVYCAAFFFGIAQQKNIFLAFWMVFVKEYRKDEENEMMPKRRVVRTLSRSMVRDHSLLFNCSWESNKAIGANRKEWCM